MEIRIEDFIVIFFLGFGILLCIGVGISILVRRIGNRYANLFLGLLLILTALTLLNQFLAGAGIYNQFQYLYFIPLVFTFSFGPLYYFFIRAKCQAGFSFEKKYLVHFILPILQFGFYLVIGFRSAEYKSMIWRELYGPYLQYLDEGGFIILMLIYLYMARKLTRSLPSKHWQEPVFKWLKSFTNFMLILVIIIGIYQIADWIAWLGYGVNIFNINYVDLPLKLTYSAFSIWMGINALIYNRQSLLLPDATELEGDGIDVALSKSLKDLFERERVYTNPDLDLNMLSKMTGAHKNNISKHFSTLGTNYNDFVNEYRVDDFIEKTKDSSFQNYSIEGLALDVGFSSRSTFNRAFKKFKGQSPSEFLSSVSV